MRAFDGREEADDTRVRRRASIQVFCPFGGAIVLFGAVVKHRRNVDVLHFLLHARP